MDDAKKDLAKLDKPLARRITGFLRERIAPLEDPRSLGGGDKGSQASDIGLAKALWSEWKRRQR